MEDEVTNDVIDMLVLSTGKQHLKIVSLDAKIVSLDDEIVALRHEIQALKIEIGVLKAQRAIPQENLESRPSEQKSP